MHIPRSLQNNASSLVIVVVIINILISGCSGAGTNPGVQAEPQAGGAPTSAEIRQATAAQITNPIDTSATPFQPVANTATTAPTSTPVPSPTPAVPTTWLAPYLPDAVRVALPAGLQTVENAEGVDLRVEVSQDQPLAEWVYAVVAPFPTITDGVSQDELQNAWRGQGKGDFAGVPLLVDEQTLGVFTALWGAPSSTSVQVVPSEQMLDYAWSHQPSWAIVPFEELQPRWKVLQVDGQSPLWKEFDPAMYPLTVQFGFTGTPEALARIQLPSPVLSNRDAQKMATVILTGVTALVRATAETMRRRGLTYPAKDIGTIMRAADIAHVSNEIPFDPNCPQPDPYQQTLVFCSRPEYIQLLEEIGTDVVELTGDHFADFGSDAMRYTLAMYQERNWPYYGGGANRDEARQATTFDVNGNKIAFIGCNGKGKPYATASETQPGAVICDFDWLSGEIARLRQEGYNVIFTSQHFEYYTYKAQPPLIKDFRAMADAGATIVSGSQAHQPHGMEFYGNTFIHYGLGNLFFDQHFMGLPTSQGFLDRYVFYDNQLISVEPIGIYFVDLARPRLMTAEERADLLRTIFNASGW